jgi:hypothetical protein
MTTARHDQPPPSTEPPWAVNPRPHFLLTVEVGWTHHQHREWLAHLLVAELLGGHSSN